MTSFFPQCYHIRPNCLIENMCLQNIKLNLVVSWIFHVNVVLRIKTWFIDTEISYSQSCADSDWNSYHSLLCTGSKTEPSRRSALQKFVEHANGKSAVTVHGSISLLNNFHRSLGFMMVPTIHIGCNPIF